MKNTFIILLIAVYCLGCSTAYKAARQTKKENKIFAAAISNNNVAGRLDEYFALKHSFRAPVLIKGKDSIVYVHDSIKIDKVHDSLIKVDCPNLDLDSLRKANTTTNKEFHFIHDTLPVVDTFCQRKLDNLQNNYSNLSGKFEQQTSQLNEVKSEKRKQTFWLIGVSIFSVLAIGGLTYLLFKK